MKAHHSPTPSEIVQRFQFNRQDRHKEETMANFVAELHELAEFCNYGKTLSDRHAQSRDHILAEIVSFIGSGTYVKG